ncbi:MAG: hypothetical protein U1F98_14450 [Verrucomicrobiota bacterium]
MNVQGPQQPVPASPAQTHNSGENLPPSQRVKHLHGLIQENRAAIDRNWEELRRLDAQLLALQPDHPAAPVASPAPVKVAA